MSLTFSPLTIAACLCEAEGQIGRPLNQPMAPMQEHLLEVLPLYAAALPHLKSFVRATAAPTAAEINAWLAAAGFPDLRLEDWEPDSRDFGVAGLLSAQINWQEPATELALNVDDKPYPAFLAKEGGQRCCVMPVSAGEPVVSIEGRDGLVLRLQVVPEPPYSVFQLMAEGRRLVELSIDPMFTRQYQGAIIPMVKLQESPDVSWLKGLRTAAVQGEYWEIAQALQQVRFGLNQYGARAMEASAMQIALRGGARGSYYEVDGPFYLTIHQRGLSVPIFAAYITPDHWANPGDLAQMTSW